MLKKAPGFVELYARRDARHFVFCHDSDGNDPTEVRLKLEASLDRVVQLCPSRFIAVPVQELEAWIIADEDAISRVIPSIRIKPQPNPERIPKPKEWLRKQSLAGHSKRHYKSRHNPMVAHHLELERVRRKCRSFDELASFLERLPL